MGNVFGTEFRRVENRDHLGKPADVDAWTRTDEGRAFVQRCGRAWCQAALEAGADPDQARAQAARTIAFYTGS